MIAPHRGTSKIAAAQAKERRDFAETRPGCPPIHYDPIRYDLVRYEQPLDIVPSSMSLISRRQRPLE